MKADWISSTYSLGAPAPHPRDQVAVVARRAPSLATNAYASRLWRVSLEDGSRTALNGGRDDDEAPAFSHDGRWLAFLRRIPGGNRQLAVCAWGSDDVRILTPADTDIDELAWSPVSNELAYVAVSAMARPGATGDMSGDLHAPLLTTRLFYDLDEHGYFADRHSNIHMIDVDRPGSGRQLTDGQAHDRDFAWSPDGTRLCFASDRRARALGENVIDAFIIGTDGTGLRNVTKGGWTLYSPCFGADARTLVFVGTPLAGNGVNWTMPAANIYAIDAFAEGAAAQTLTAWPDIELPLLYMPLPVSIAIRGERLFFSAPKEGQVRLMSVSLAGGPVQAECDGGVNVQRLAAAGAASPLLATVKTWNSPGEVAVWRDGAIRVLTDFANELDVGPIAKPVAIDATASDGYPVRGNLFFPPGDGPHPLVLSIHGGPYYFDTTDFGDDRHAHTMAGYAYLVCNNRGSMGYGIEHASHAFAPCNPENPAVADDLLALVEAAARDPRIDARRIAVTGASFGGFMTSWFALHSKRFVAGIAENAPSMARYMTYTSDISWPAHKAFSGVEDPYQRSLLGVPLVERAHKDCAPLLIAQFEGDRRVPKDQSVALYRALAAERADTALLLFPDGQHLMPDIGLPRLRRHRLEFFLAWWARFMPTLANPLTPDNVYEQERATALRGLEG